MIRNFVGWLRSNCRLNVKSLRALFICERNLCVPNKYTLGIKLSIQCGANKL